MSNSIYCVEDARLQARKRLPKMIFDFIDGAAGYEYANHNNQKTLDSIRMLPRGLVDITARNQQTRFLNENWSLPFGIAPMGMCNLAWPNADAMLARAAVSHNIPVCLSTAGSTSIEDMAAIAGKHGWFQLYVGQSIENSMALVDRAIAADYSALILTIDAQQVAVRLRDKRNGFGAPLKIGPKQFVDFALHPRWSLSTLLSGAPTTANIALDTGDKTFDRNATRGVVDLEFVSNLRKHWPRTLIVKGVLSPEDAVSLKECGVDAVYVSNHGGRQFDSAPAPIEQLPKIRQAVGAEFPLIFDSGVRNGAAIVKAYALGANFVMLGRPYLYAMAADGETGLNTVISLLEKEVDDALAQLGKPDLELVDSSVLLD